jgi:hypothetical protein
MADTPNLPTELVEQCGHSLVHPGIPRLAGHTSIGTSIAIALGISGETLESPKLRYYAVVLPVDPVEEHIACGLK